MNRFKRKKKGMNKAKRSDVKISVSLEKNKDSNP